MEFSIGELELSNSSNDKYKYTEYLDKIKINDNDFGTDQDYYIPPDLIPSNVKHIIFEVGYDVKLQVGSIGNNVETITFTGDQSFNQILTYGIFPESITSIKFCNVFNQTLGGWLPNSIKSLSLGDSFHHSIYKGELPGSLEHLEIHKNYKGTIEQGSIPIGVSSLNFKFFSNGNTNILAGYNSIYTVPKATTSLEFDDDFNQNIKFGMVPQNVTYLKFGNSWNSEINVNALPNSLTSIKFGNGFNSEFKKGGIFPNSLKFIDMGGFNKFLTITNIFPKSVTSIIFNNLCCPIPIGYFSKNTNLKTLSLGCMSNREIPADSLPHSLTSLKYDGYSISPINIDNESTVNIPSSLLSLELSGYNKPMDTAMLPRNLKHLYFPRYDFNQYLSVHDLPQSLESISVNIKNKEFIKTLDTDFFLKYIRFSEKGCK